MKKRQSFYQSKVKSKEDIKVLDKFRCKNSENVNSFATCEKLKTTKNPATFILSLEFQVEISRCLDFEDEINGELTGKLSPTVWGVPR